MGSRGVSGILRVQKMKSRVKDHPVVYNVSEFEKEVLLWEVVAQREEPQKDPQWQTFRERGFSVGVGGHTAQAPEKIS